MQCSPTSSTRYEPLFVQVACDLPGLCEALVVHLTEYVLSSLSLSASGDESYDGNQEEVQIFSKNAVDWIYHFMSESFVMAAERHRRHHDMDAQEEARTKSPENLVSLLSMLPFQVPVRVLIERCRHTANEESFATIVSWQRDLVQQMHDIFCRVESHGGAKGSILSNEVISDEQCYFKNDDPAPSNGGVQSDKTTHRSSTTAANPAHSSILMSLEEMEVLLLNQTDQVSSATTSTAKINSSWDHPSDANLEPKKDTDNGGTATSPMINAISSSTTKNTVRSSNPVSPWTRCEHWEPCPIGILPGYPVI
jgi:hypothetical protein